MDKCAPGKNYTDNSCFNIKNLIDISEHFNKNFPNYSFNIKKDKKYLLKNLTSRMKKQFNCDNQLCWVKTNFIKSMNDDEILNYTFRPQGPKGKFDWLSTSNIDDVMYQYENIYNDFKFLGAVPNDFEDLEYLETYNFDLKKIINKKKNKIGMIINLDPSTKGGSHWVAFYSNLKKNQIFFFDSFAQQPDPRVFKFMKKLYKNMKGNNNLFDIRYNKIRHQFDNSECGVYSMNFIIRLLNGETFDEITNNITKDEDMNKCRKKYFN